MTPQHSLPSMQGKTCLVTGATAGIGFITARELARAGARVLIVARSPEKGAETIRRIAEETGAQTVEALTADLASQADIRALAREVKSRVDRLDVLINNAGVILLDRRESVDGIEMTFAVNHLAYFLLTNLLLDLLKASSPARIVNVASGAHRGAKINFDDIGGREHYSGWRAYQQSKLANILFTRELAKALTGTGVTANSLHPGYVNTQIFREEGLRGLVMRCAAGLFAIAPERGAETTLYLATSPDVQGESGEYYARSKPASISKEARNEAAARRLWQFSEDLAGMKSQTV
ncbi:MAG: SDR family oxidoreductase [Paludisphaera borealis]|uniref:SDR family oxidoreductase n=1 Tax=Paludisphaera borealis TaxID=1387353 RepID=UPI002841676D|nr:SDR family oxidoreductase [Paludisphaera borealis]MDR3618201.1 SDR family oxidoreductase [Paludisphaera borealis]